MDIEYKKSCFEKIDRLYTQMSELMDGKLGSENPCGNCHSCCTLTTTIPVSAMDLDYLDYNLGADSPYSRERFIEFFDGKNPEMQICPNYNLELKGCNFYKYRPMVCRTFGFAPESLAPIHNTECCFCDRVSPEWEGIEPLVVEFNRLNSEYYDKLSEEFTPVTAFDYYSIANLSAFKGDHEKAARYYEEAAKKYAKQGIMRMEYLAKARRCENLDDWKGAVALYKDISILFPYDFKSMISYAEALQRIGDFQESLNVYGRVLHYMKSSLIYRSMGLSYSRIGDNENALKYYDMAIEFNDIYVDEVRCSKAIVLEQMGRNEESREILEDLFERNPNNELVAISLIILYSKLNDLKNLIRVYKKLAELYPDAREKIEQTIENLSQGLKS